jgi:hypothetical protein
MMNLHVEPIWEELQRSQQRPRLWELRPWSLLRRKLLQVEVSGLGLNTITKQPKTMKFRYVKVFEPLHAVRDNH